MTTIRMALGIVDSPGKPDIKEENLYWERYFFDLSFYIIFSMIFV